MRLLAKQSIVICMAADPEPHKAVRSLVCKCPIVTADPSRPEAADPLEMKRRVMRVLFQAARRIDRRAVGSLAAAIDSTPRNRVMRGESERLCLSGCVVTKGLVGKLVKLAGLDVFLKLAVPHGPVVFQKPGAELR